MTLQSCKFKLIGFFVGCGGVFSGLLSKQYKKLVLQLVLHISKLTSPFTHVFIRLFYFIAF